jgi:hypothetical protein
LSRRANFFDADLPKCLVSALLGFINFRFAGGFDEAFGLLGVVGLAFWFSGH